MANDTPPGVLGMFDSGGSAPSNNPGVYMGGQWTPPRVDLPDDVWSYGSAAGDLVAGTQVPNGREGIDWIRDPATGKIFELAKQENIINMFFQFNEAVKDDLRMKLALTGNQNALRMNDSDLFSRWTAYVKLASQYAAAGKPVSPWELLNNDIMSAERAKQTMQPTVTETTSTRTDLTSFADAEAIFYQSARTLLGRAPTDEETASFHAALNAQETENPIVQRVRRTTSAMGDTTEEVISQEGGLSGEARQMAALKEAQANPEYGAYQASTTYMNAFKEMIYGRGY